MGLGTDIASRLDEKHTLRREHQILQAFRDGQFVPLEWTAVPVSHRFADGRELRGTVWVATRAPRLGDCDDNFLPNVNHPTAQRIVDDFAGQPKANAPKGVVLPTARISDFARKAAAFDMPACTQPPDGRMRDTSRMLEHSACVDRAIDGRVGKPSTEGKAWCNTTRLNGHPELAANYGLYAAAGRYRSVDGLPLWQPGPGIKHISGLLVRGGKLVRNAAHPEGYTDYSQVLENLVRVDMLVEGHGEMDIRQVAEHPVLCWLISSEGPVRMRHPAVPEAGAAEPLEPADIDRAAPDQPGRLALLTRTLRRGMMGQDVAFVQRVVGTNADGIFGPATERAVKAWQAKHSFKGKALATDGIVGPRTRGAMLAAVAGAVPPSDDEAVSDGFDPRDYDPFAAEYIQARYYRQRGGQPVVRTEVHHILIHTAEAAELPTTAEALGRYGKTMADGRFASWHWAYDCDSGVKCCPEEWIAYHAKAANPYSVGYEHAGYARQTRAEWLDDYSESMLWISAMTAARYTGPRWGIPLDNVLTVEQLRRCHRDYLAKGKTPPDELRGFVFHSTVTKALGGTHTDPGEGFPTDRYLEMVREAA